METVTARENRIKNIPQPYWMRVLYDSILRLAHVEQVHTVLFNATLEERGRAKQFLFYVAQVAKYVRETDDEYLSLHPRFTLTGEEIHLTGKPFIKELYKEGTQRIGYFQSWANQYNWNSGMRKHRAFQCARTEQGWHPQQNNGRGYVLGIPVKVSKSQAPYPKDLSQQSIHYAIRDPALREKADVSIACALQIAPVEKQKELLRMYATIKSKL